MHRSSVVAPDAVTALIGDLRRRGYRTVGPRLRDGAIVYDEVTEMGDLPVGWTDVQTPGGYRVHRRDDDALFGYAVGPHSWKRELFPPRQTLWRAHREGDTGFRVEHAEQEPQRLALFGVRGCELAAIAIQDRVFLHGLAVDPDYAARRRDLVVVAVNCTSPAGTCFCSSMGTGPRVGEGADLVVTELVGDGCHELLVDAHTTLGDGLLAPLGGRPVEPDDRARAERALASAEEAVGRTVDADALHDALLGALEDPHWEDIGRRCLTCGNCTLVCPTCFCTQVEDVTDLEGETAARERRWDTCFALGFSQVGPASIRRSGASRYRQWMTHKLATWVDQFGTSGCVGCGRCITWCPVGIDITAEAAVFTEVTS